MSMKVLSKQAPQKKDLARLKQMHFMTQDLSREIIKRSIKCNRFSKNKSQENRMLYTQQRNYCVALLRKTKIRYFSNLKKKKILDNKEFWTVVKPLFFDKSISGDKTNLTEDNRSFKHLFLKYNKASQESAGLKY